MILNIMNSYNTKMGARRTRLGSVEGYNSLKDSHLTHYFSRADVLRHLMQMGLVSRTGEIVPENEWRRLYAQQQREEKEREKESHSRRLLEAEEAARRRIREKIRRKEAQLTRQPSTSEPDLIHFDIEWSFRPVSITTESPGTSGTTGTSNGSSDVISGVQSGTGGNGEGTSYDTSGSRGRNGDHIRITGFSESSPENAPHWRKQNKYSQKPRFVENRGVVGEPYIKSLGPNPSPRYIHIIKPTNSCREVWSRLCPPQPINTRQPPPKPPPYFRLVYAGGGAPCHTPTDLSLLQQPAGAHNVTVFHGMVKEGDEIEFTSYRRENFPFSLTIYEDGVTTGRLSACCEHRYAAGSRLGGPSGHLRVLEIIGGEPCLRCQMRSVEKKHLSRQRANYQRSKGSEKPTEKSVGKPQLFTPPEESENESISQEEESISSSNHSKSSRGSTGRSSRGTQTPIRGIGRSNSDSEDSSTDIESDRSKCFRNRKGTDKRALKYSSDSCNGPSDLEVAAALGVPSKSSKSPKKRRGRRKHSASRRPSSSYTSRKDSDIDDACKGISETNDESESHKNSISNQRPFHISSSMEGQLDDTVTGRSQYQNSSKIAFSSRNSSARSPRSKSGRSRSRQSSEDAFNKVDSFYSQQNFTSSASETQGASDNANEQSYGSSFEEDEDEDNNRDNSENSCKTKESASSANEKEAIESDIKDENMETDEDEKLKSVTSEVEEEAEELKVNSEREHIDDTEVEVDSEILSIENSKAETVKESEKSGACSISEDVGEDSDIVGLSCSEEEIIEEENKKEEGN